MSLATYTSIRHSIEMMVNAKSEVGRYGQLVKAWSMARAYTDVVRQDGLSSVTVEQFEKMNSVMSTYYQGYGRNKEYLKMQARYSLDRLRVRMVEEIYEAVQHLEESCKDMDPFAFNFGMSVKKRRGCFSCKIRSYDF